MNSVLNSAGSQNAIPKPSALANQPVEHDITPWPTDVAEAYRHKGYWRDESLALILQKKAQQHADAIAIIDGDQQWSYQQLWHRTQQLGASFQALGINAGDNVVVQLPNQSAFIEVFFALINIGAVPVLALPAHRATELNHFIRHSNAKAFIGYATFESNKAATQPLKQTLKSVGGFNHYSEATELVRHIIAVPKTCEFDTPTHNNNEHIHLLNTLYTANTHISQSTINADKIALLQLSGGTTNVPKLIPRSHNDYYYSIRESVKLGGLTSQSRYLAVLPAAHNFTLSSPGLLGVLEAGGSIIFSAISEAKHAFNLIEKHQITHCALVPPLAIAWLQHQQSTSAAPSNTANKASNLTSLAVLQVGGAKLSAVTAKKLKAAFKCQIQQVFGMAEGLVNYTRLDDADDIVLNTQGKPISIDDEIVIVDDNDQPLPIGEAGHLLTRGPYTIRGYYRAASHNAQAFTPDGFYRTGDIVSLTPEGYLVVEGRHKDQINRGGEKISAAEVEEQLLKHPAIIDAAVVAMDDEYLGERSCAYVITQDNTRINLIAIKRFLREQGLAEYKYPDRIEMINKFPKTHFGKVSKKALRQRINQQLAEINAALT